VPTPTPSPTPTPDLRPPAFDPPIRAAFYYPWWNGEDRNNSQGTASHWDECLGRNTQIDSWNELLGCIPTDTPFDQCERVHYKPDYDGNGHAEAYLWDEATVATQMENMRYGHISAVVSSWWGNGSTSDIRLQNFFDWAATHDPGFKLAPYFEYGGSGKAGDFDQHEYPTDPPPKSAPSDPTELAQRLWTYLDNTWNDWARKDRVLALDGRPVIFVYHPSERNCDTVTLWRDALDILEDYHGVRPFIVLLYWPAGPSCAAADEADFAFHHYSTGQGAYQSAYVDGETQTATIRPGFWRCRLAEPGQQRDSGLWEDVIDTMNDDHVRWFQLIVSYNEWMEGTAVEPSTDWRIHPVDPPIDPDPGEDDKGAIPGDKGTYLDALGLRPPQ